MGLNVQPVNEYKFVRSQIVVRLRSRPVAAIAERERVKIGSALPDSARAEMGGLYATMRETHDTRQAPYQCQVLRISHRLFCFVDRAGIDFGCLHDSEYTKRFQSSQEGTESFSYY